MVELVVRFWSGCEDAFPRKIASRLAILPAWPSNPHTVCERADRYSSQPDSLASEIHSSSPTNCSRESFLGFFFRIKMYTSSPGTRPFWPSCKVQAESGLLTTNYGASNPVQKRLRMRPRKMTKTASPHLFALCREATERPPLK
jgi:hypothetical protein